MRTRFGGGRGASAPVRHGLAPRGRRHVILSDPTDHRTGEIESTELPNGVQILTESMQGVRSVAVGIWVRHGSVNESPDQRGISHLLEHMVFKGTEKRSARDIALALESLGGSLDAYTGREQTSFQARVLDEHLPEAIDVLADLTRSPRIRDSDLELERDVVLEEIAMVEDTPDDLVFELHGEKLWAGHPYGHSILGTRETVSTISADALQALHRERYTGANLVIAAAGNLTHDQVAGQVESLFADLPPGERSPPPVDPPTTVPAEEREVRPGAQSHIVFGTATPGHGDPARYPLVILSAALGAGMSSRLFQKIREEMALCYTVFSYQSFYSRGGVTGVYVGTRPEWSDRAVDAVRAELALVAREGLPHDELERTKQQVKGHLMLALESSGSRLHRLAGFALYEEPFASLNEVIARVDAVNADVVSEAASRYLDPDRHRVLRLGPDGSA